MGSLHALLIVANVVSVANSNFQLATLVLIIGNILTMATFNKIVCWGHSPGRRADDDEVTAEAATNIFDIVIG